MTLVYTNHILQSLNVVQNNIDIYLLDYSKFYHRVEYFKTLLSGDEMARAQRYQSWAQQDRFIVQHGFTREILAYHLETSPETIDINAPKFCKPETNGIHFNISHSDDFLAVAISKDTPVGVDIESMDRNIDLNHVAAIVLSDAERMKLFAFPKSAQKMILLQTWVCKEAFWKFVGEGLNGMIKQFELMPTNDKDDYTMSGSKRKFDQHTIHSFATFPNRLVGAIAYAGNNAEIRFRINEFPVLD
jgi:4'-phosphopantetheinyl transferase